MLKLPEILLKYQQELLKKIPDFERDAVKKINWDFPLIGLKGPRGVGKTTIMLQQLKHHPDNGLYFSCDNVFVIEYGLLRLVSDLTIEHGKRFLYIDEIHKYPNWSQELKNITDSLPDVHVAISGSSSIDIISEGADLSRRILLYTIHPLSFREYLSYYHQISLPPLSLEEIFTDYKRISFDLSPHIRRTNFDDYLSEYAYFYRAQVKTTDEYRQLLDNAIKKTLYEDIPRIFALESSHLLTLEKILFLLSNISPSEMNFSNIGKKVNINPRTAEHYCSILEKTGLVSIIRKYGTITHTLLKEKKILLSNTNLLKFYQHLFGGEPTKGMLREVFFVECIKRARADISLHSKQDYLLEYKGKKVICEVGGRSKKLKKPDANTFVIADDIITGYENRIPLWIFGLIES
ncbi:MAG: AAA family ATPase [bacterium]|nr:AAA family ATPase [bacterium]